MDRPLPGLFGGFQSYIYIHIIADMMCIYIAYPNRGIGNAQYVRWIALKRVKPEQALSKKGRVHSRRIKIMARLITTNPAE